MTVAYSPRDGERPVVVRLSIAVVLGGLPSGGTRGGTAVLGTVALQCIGGLGAVEDTAEAAAGAGIELDAEESGSGGSGA